MNTYLLFERARVGGHWQLWEYSSAIWSDLNTLHAYISVLLDVETLEITNEASNSWIINDAFKIVGTSIN